MKASAWPRLCWKSATASRAAASSASLSRATASTFPGRAGTAWSRMGRVSVRLVIASLRERVQQLFDLAHHRLTLDELVGQRIELRGGVGGGVESRAERGILLVERPERVGLERFGGLLG